MSKKIRFKRLFDKEHGKRSQTLLKSAQQQLYHIYWLLWGKLSPKKSLLVICNILGRFVDTLNTHDKYSVRDRDNLTEPIVMQLSHKERFLFWTFFCILEI